MKIDNRDVFEQIGNLFYSIAAGQHVKPLEVGELKALISKTWLPRNANESVVSDETHFIILTLDALEANNVTASDAFKDFAKFYAVHPEVFTTEVKQRMLDTAEEITRIFKEEASNVNTQLKALKELLDINQVKV